MIIGANLLFSGFRRYSVHFFLVEGAPAVGAVGFAAAGGGACVLVGANDVASAFLFKKMAQMKIMAQVAKIIKDTMNLMTFLLLVSGLDCC